MFNICLAEEAYNFIRDLSAEGGNVLFDDIADRLRARGLNAAVDYGFDKGVKIPLVVGLKDKPFALAVQAKACMG